MLWNVVRMIFQLGIGCISKNIGLFKWTCGRDVEELIRYDLN